jgi:imidazolonepropionase-like amidohydrolase
MLKVIKNCNLFEPLSDKLVPAVVTIEGERIASVQSPGEASFDPGAQIIDARQMTLMPGMTTGHWHPDYPNLSMSDLWPPSVYIGQHKPPAYLSAVSGKHLLNALHSGFTAVVGAGCGHDIDAALKMAIDDGQIEGPRIRAAGHHINTTGSDNDRAKWWYDIRPPYKDGISIVGAELFADGHDALQRAVRDEIKRGVEVIKVFPTGGHGFPAPPNYRGMTKEELTIICETAHDRGAVVRAHVVGADALLECIASGVDIVDHGDDADERCIEAMVKHGTFLVPSMLFLKEMLKLPAGSIADEFVVGIEKDYAHLLQFVHQAHKAGIRIVPGDDYGLSFIPHVPGIYFRDLMIWIEESEVPVQDVLGWATAHGAALMNRSDLGKIKPGFTADMLLVDGDVLQNPSVLLDPEANLHMIMIGGRIVKDNGASARNG